MSARCGHQPADAFYGPCTREAGHGGPCAHPFAGPAVVVDGVIPLRERRSLADEWKEFERRVISPKAPPVQRKEMRMAFYGGASMMFSLISGGLDADSEPTDLDIAYLDTLSKELVAFASDLAGGHA